MIDGDDNEDDEIVEKLFAVLAEVEDCEADVLGSADL